MAWSRLGWCDPLEAVQPFCACFLICIKLTDYFLDLLRELNEVKYENLPGTLTQPRSLLFVVIVTEGIHPGTGESAGCREGTGLVASGASGQILSWQAIQKVPGKPEAWWVVGTSQQLSLLGSQKENEQCFPRGQDSQVSGTSSHPAYHIAWPHLTAPVAGSRLEGAGCRSVGIRT